VQSVLPAAESPGGLILWAAVAAVVIFLLVSVTEIILNIITTLGSGGGSGGISALARQPKNLAGRAGSPVLAHGCICPGRRE
jgi:hypothetical protein